jgi:hypothetical protein
MTHLLDQFRNYNIHEDDYRALPAKVRDAFDRFESIEFYTAGLKNGKKVNKIKEFKRVVRAYKKNIDKHPDEDSNIECIMIDQMLELLRRMPAADIRKLGLEKLL